METCGPSIKNYILSNSVFLCTKLSHTTSESQKHERDCRMNVQSGLCPIDSCWDTVLWHWWPQYSLQTTLTLPQPRRQYVRSHYLHEVKSRKRFPKSLLRNGDISSIMKFSARQNAVHLTIDQCLWIRDWGSLQHPREAGKHGIPLKNFFCQMFLNNTSTAKLDQIWVSVPVSKFLSWVLALISPSEGLWPESCRLK